MARVLLSETKDWKLADKDQDLRGWEVRDARGQPIGRVADLIVDTDAERVDTIVLEDGATFRAADVSLADDVVYVESYGAPAHARPYGAGHEVHRAEPLAPAVAATAAPPPEVAERAHDRGVFADHEELFRRHYRDAYGDLDYADYAPAYRFGYDVAYDDRYTDRDFEAIEPELREAYYRRHGYPMSDNLVWNHVREAVRHAYRHARGQR
ncbi:MAG TPA: PRC-barrel domain-containing protein [Rubricoccaceae bacterium]|nr:PRC-barrel domain-containing protein [Rubricoccaceae bacterium]